MNKQDRQDLNKAINSRWQWYVGLIQNKFVAFSTREKMYDARQGTNGPSCYPYSAVVGPFRTKRAALWAEKHGFLNPHFQTVNDAERIAKQQTKG